MRLFLAKILLEMKLIFWWVWQYIKRSSFFIPFLIVWGAFQAPIVYGLSMYVLTRENKYLFMALSWYALTAPPLPIPVVPISVGTGIFFEKILSKRGK